jgi:hypothetical protein
MKLASGIAVTLLALAWTSADASAAGRDFASGAFRYDCSPFACGGDVSFTGHGSPTDAIGHIRIDVRDSGVDIQTHGDVGCVIATGSTATLLGTLDESFVIGGGPPADSYLLRVHDNGPPRGGISPDRAFLGFGSQLVQDCAFWHAFPFEGSPVTRGNIVVRDRAPESF